jgi:hypothetical protein
MHNSVEFILLHQDLSTVIGDNAFTKASRAPDCDKASLRGNEAMPWRSPSVKMSESRNNVGRTRCVPASCCPARKRWSLAAPWRGAHDAS